MPKLSLFKLYPFQEEDVAKIDEFKGRVLNANDMGLGKTIETIAWWIKDKPSPVIVTCPANAKWHWEDEFKKFAGMRCDVLDGRVPRRRQPIVRAKIVIVNFDIVQYWIKYLRSLNAQLLVIDECQNIRAPDRQVGMKQTMYSGRTIAVRKISRGIPYCLALGGTGALENRPAEMFAVLNILRPDLFPSFFSYAARYCSPVRKPWGWEYKGATNLSNLHKKLKKHLMIRRRKEDVLPDLPKRSRIVIPIRDIPLKEYERMRRDFRHWCREREGHKKRLQGDDRAAALNKLGEMLRFCGQSKIRSVIQWTEEFLDNTGEKIILFAIHKKTIRQLKRHFHDRSVVVDGSINKQDRRLFVRSFNEDKECRVFIGQLKAAGTCWSAKQCNTTATLEYWWNPATHTQADDRIYGLHRGEAGKPKFNYYFTAKGTFEETMCRLLQRKQGEIDTVLDGRQVTQFNLMDQLVKEIAA